MPNSFVWIVQTAEPDAEIVGVFATREALDYEYPGMTCPHLDPRSLMLSRRGHEDLYATRLPLHAYYPERDEGRAEPGADS